jgi:hypothetical protein
MKGIVMPDTVNFVIYKKPKLTEAQEKRVATVKLVDVVRQIVAQLGQGGDVTENTERQSVIVRNTTNFAGARLKMVIGELYEIQSFLNDHPRANGVNSRPASY